MTASEFHAKWRGIRTSHSDGCPRSGGFDFETCTCGLDELWAQRNVDLRSVSDPEQLERLPWNQS